MDLIPKIKSNLAELFKKSTSRLIRLCDTVDNPTYWVYENLHISLYDNQIDIVNSVCDLSVPNIAIAQARGSGKTFSVAIALIKLCLDNPGLKIGIFGPKSDQAIRIISEIYGMVKPTMPIYKRIIWKESVKSRLVFDNGSDIIALSADMSTMNEGYHFHIVVIDEAHQVEDIAVSQRIGPMLGSLPIGKMIKIGITLYKNHFWKSCMSPKYKTLITSWDNAPILLTNNDSLGQTWYKGKELSTRIVNLMPLSLKQKYFPDRPDLHFDGEVTELDFKTQYSMEWVTDINLELTEEEQTRLVSGTHDILQRGLIAQQEHYYFGLDTAPGSLLPGKKDLDFTVLSIWRKRSNGLKEKVKCYEWQGDVIAQIDEIKQIIHPQTGIFPCKFGLADYSNIAQNAVAAWQKEKIPIEGIIFGHREEITGKNFKNAMFDQFKFELQHNRVFFPSLQVLNTDVCMKKSFNEWCHIERHFRQGINHDIKAPSEMHDDHCCADVLAVWAMDHAETFPNIHYKSQGLPAPKINAVPSLMSNRGGQRENRYLK